MFPVREKEKIVVVSFRDGLTMMAISGCSAETVKIQQVQPELLMTSGNTALLPTFGRG
jgi:hypothetical protein